MLNLPYPNANPLFPNSHLSTYSEVGFHIPVDTRHQRPFHLTSLPPLLSTYLSCLSPFFLHISDRKSEASSTFSPQLLVHFLCSASTFHTFPTPVSGLTSLVSTLLPLLSPQNVSNFSRNPPSRGRIQSPKEGRGSKGRQSDHYYNSILDSQNTRLTSPDFLH